MRIDYKSLTTHLRGCGVPKTVIHDIKSVMNVLSEFEPSQVYQVLEPIKALLAKIANNPQLTPDQQALVKKSYLILKGDHTILDQQLIKDVKAITEPEPESSWEVHWSTISKGVRGIAKCDRISIAGVQPIYRLLWEKYSSRVTFDPNNLQEHVNLVVSKSQQRFQAELDHWASLPDDLRSQPIWDIVFLGTNIRSISPKGNTTPECVGNIDVTQEPGMKLRLFASPFLMYQAALEPLKISLKRATAAIPQDCHLDQQSGAKWAQEQLKLNRTVHSFDLSSATHRFPWSLQLKVLRSLNVPKQCLDLYTHVAKGEYGFRKALLQWNAGQPLGTGPSFFSFSLAHHALVRGICADLRTDPDCYRILGDDIVIANSQVAKVYEKLMNKFGCQINHSKSTISSTAAEFAGFQIYPDVMFRTGKLRPVTQSNWYEYGIGYKDRSLLSGRQQAILTTMDQFTSFNANESTNMVSHEVHSYVSISQCQLIAEHMQVPDTIKVWDFARVVSSVTAYQNTGAGTILHKYYHTLVTGLAAEIIEMLEPDSWVRRIKEANYQIMFGVRALLLELASCPTQCCPVWAHKLMAKEGKKYGFLQARRLLIRMATANRLMRPPLWMVRSSKFAEKIHNLMETAKTLERANTLSDELFSLELREAERRATLAEIAGRPDPVHEWAEEILVFDY